MRTYEPITQSNLVEYRVRPVTRWVITRHQETTNTYKDGHSGGSVGSETLGEFDNEDQANRVRNILHAQDGTDAA